MAAAENLVQAPPPEAKKSREFGGFKCHLKYEGQQGFHIDTEVRYAKADIEPVFSAEGVQKVGPHDGSVRFVRGDWKVLETQADGSELEVSQESLHYMQEADGQKSEVEPFDATKSWDIKEERPLEECTLDGAVALGTVFPVERVDEFGPDKEAGSSLYKVKGDEGALRALADKLLKDRLALYFPHVFRRGMTIHLAVVHVVRLDGSVYL